MFRDGRIRVGKRRPQGRIGTPVPTEVTATSSNSNVLEVREDGPADRTSGISVTAEVGVTSVSKKSAQLQEVSSASGTPQVEPRAECHVSPNGPSQSVC